MTKQCVALQRVDQMPLSHLQGEGGCDDVDEEDYNRIHYHPLAREISERTCEITPERMAIIPAVDEARKADFEYPAFIPSGCLDGRRAENQGTSDDHDTVD